MKRSLSVFVLTIIIAPLCLGQATQADHRTMNPPDDIAERLGLLIEKFIVAVKKELSSPEQEALSDTILVAQDSSDQEPLQRAQASITFDGNKTVETEESIRANVVVKGGDLTVYGTVYGDVLVVGGTLYVKEGGKITGNARVINGDIVREENGFIDGYSDKTKASTAGYRFDRGRFSRSAYRLDASWVDELTNFDNFIYRFNRVEGHFFGLGSEKRYYWDGYKRFSLYGSVGWGAKSHRWRYNLGLARQFALSDADDGGELLEMGIEGHSLTDTKDQWIIGMNENTGAALLLHEDFRDYFGREGFSGHIGFYTRRDFMTAQLKISYVVDKYSSLEKKTEWSIFGGNKTFRENPPIKAGRMRSIVISPGFSTTSRTSYGQEGWSISGTAEFASTRYGSDFDFSQGIADIRRYQPLSRYDNLNIRLRAGTSGGSVPVQKRFQLGGLSSLHARGFKSNEGNRMILLNAEYIVNGDFLHDLDFWPGSILRHVNFIIMSDAGFMRDIPPQKGWLTGFENIRFSDFQHDAGVGLANRSGSFRVGFVWRTDIKAPAKLFFRFQRPF